MRPNKKAPPAEDYRQAQRFRFSTSARRSPSRMTAATAEILVSAPAVKCADALPNFFREQFHAEGNFC